jgi:hypothetical protein
MAGKPRQKSLGLEEAVDPVPHYHGHRQRLRERLLAGGPKTCPITS